MMMTPLAPRAPYSAVSAGSFSTSIDSMSLGLTPVRYPLGPGSIATPSSTYNGLLPLLMEEPPRMRTAKPPSAVTVAPGAEVEGGGDAAGLFRWAQPELSPMKRPNGSKARIENEVIGVL